MSTTTTIRNDRSVQLPKTTARRLALHKGDKVVIETKGSIILIRSVTNGGNGKLSSSSPSR